MKTKLFLAFVSFEHLCIDLLCIFTLSTIVRTGLLSANELLWLYFLYSLTAFGTQVIWGSLMDNFGYEKYVLLVSGFMVIMGFLLIAMSPLLAVLLAGLGNALFHVSAGSLVLQGWDNKFGPIGIFVAPGAIGVLLGSYSISQNISWGLPVSLLIILLTILAFWMAKKMLLFKSNQETQQASFLPIILILCIVVLRAFTGSVLVFSWKSIIELLFVLTFAITVGKAVGGLLADRFSWFKVVVISMCIAFPLVIFDVSPVFGIVGSLLLNITMAITVVLLYRLLPGKPGTTFGLTCLALFIGGTPGYSPQIKGVFNNAIFPPLAILLTLLLIIIFYKRYSKHEK